MFLVMLIVVSIAGIEEVETKVTTIPAMDTTISMTKIKDAIKANSRPKWELLRPSNSAANHTHKNRHTHSKSSQPNRRQPLPKWMHWIS